MNDCNYLRIKSKLNYFVFLVTYFLLYPVAKLLYGRKSNWVICERGYDAQDNGFVFFKYIVDHHPSLNVWYIISPNSADYNKVKLIGKTVNYCSFKHFLMVVGCPVKISTHLFGYAPWTSMATYFRRNKTHDKHIFLQHGIIKNLHEGLFGNVCKSLDVFICGAKPEYDFIVDKFNYSRDIPKYTGLARYDNLNNFSTRNQLLVMPTWRSELVDYSLDKFIETDFYKSWTLVINNRDLLEVCAEKNILIKFYLHHSFQKFSNLFKGNNYVKIIKFGEENVQNLLKESKLLITDFSSVYFDFAYMMKPLIYYQFDESTFYDLHYTKGYFDYRQHGFGPVCTDCDILVKEIIKYISTDFIMDKCYIERTKSFFKYRDSRNCERIFNAIIE